MLTPKRAGDWTGRAGVTITEIKFSTVFVWTAYRTKHKPGSSRVDAQQVAR